NDNVPSLDIPEIAHRCRKRAEPTPRGRWRTLIQDSDAIDFHLLRLGRQRRNNNAPTHDGDERSPVHHSMIWSARPRTDGGMVSPSAWAVLRLITSSNLVGCSTGRSAGFAPLRILST